MPLLLQKKPLIKKSMRSIGGKLFMLRMGMGICMSVALGFLCYYSISTQTVRQYQENLANDAMAVKSSINRHFKSVENQLRRIAGSDEVIKYSESFRQTLLLRYFDRFKDDFDLLSYIGRDERIDVMLIKGDRVDTGDKVTKDPNYRRATREPNTLVISPVRFVNELDTPGLYYDYLYANYFDERVSFIRAADSLAGLRKIKEQALVYTSNKIFITNEEGIIIYSPHRQDLGKSAVSPGHYLNGLFRKGADRSETFTDSVIKGRKHKFFMTTHPELGWKIFATASLDSINKPVARLRNYIIAISLFVVIIGELLSRFMGLRLTDPIDRLNRLALSIVDSGRLSDRVEWHSADEMGELAESFNRMLDRLEDSATKLINERQFSDNVINSIIDGVATVSAEGAVIKTNAVLKDLLDYDDEDIIGLPYYSLFPETRQPLDRENRLQLSEEGFMRISDIPVQTRDGGQIPCDCTVSVIHDSSEQPVALLFILVDIREKKRLEDEKRQAQERLRKTNEELLQTEKIAAVGQTAGMIAHEVLNPLTAVNTRIELNLKKSGEMTRVIETLNRILEDWQLEIERGTFQQYYDRTGKKDLILLVRIAKTLAARQVERTEDYRFLKDQVAKILKIIDGMREMAKPETTITRISLRELIDDVLNDMQDGLYKRMITVEKNYITYPEIYADYMEIYSLLTNTIKNAMQAIEKNKESSKRKITVRLEKLPYNEALITITDTGIGMDRETRKAIFTPGFTRKGREGTGIGASLSRKLARRYGGDIKIKQSKPGEGTTLEITLATGGNDI